MALAALNRGSGRASAGRGPGALRGAGSGLRPVFAAVIALISLALAACASPPAGPPTQVYATPSDDFCPGVRDFAKVSPAIWRGSQPTAEGFRYLEAAGAGTILNVRHSTDDAELLVGTRLKYVWIPMRVWDPDVEDLVPFFRLIKDPGNWPVYIHCSLGKDRTGFFVAAYRMVVDGWSADDAIREMYKFRYSSFWFSIAKVLRSMDVEKLKARIAGP